MAGKTLHIIKNKPVYIRNKHINGYLVRAGSYNSESNNVGVNSDITSNRQLTVGVEATYIVGLNASIQMPLDYSAVSAMWNLISKGNEEYEIIHCAFNEPLFAAQNGLAYDNDRRRVLTWKQGPSIAQGLWRFEQCCNEFYTIKNTAHGEYLYAADYPSKGWVFTWREYNQNWFNDKFFWQLVEP